MSRVKRATWYKWPRGEFRTGQTIWRVVVFLLFFIYVSFLHILFYRKHSCNNRKTKSKTNTTKKHVQKCGGQAASNSIWLCPSNKTKFSSFFLSQLVLKLYPYLVPFTIKGRELTHSFSHLFYFLFFFFSFSEEQKSLLFVFNMDIQILNKYIFRRN